MKNENVNLQKKTFLTLEIFFLRTVISVMKAYQLIYLSGQTITGQLLTLYFAMS